MPTKEEREEIIREIDQLARERRNWSWEDLRIYLLEFAPKNRNGDPYAVWEDAIKSYIYDLKRVQKYSKP